MLNTPKQQWSAHDYVTHAAFVPQLGMDLLDWLKPKSGERILDLGCGDGVLTKQLHDIGVDVLGVDTSKSMLNAAIEKGIQVFHQDGQNLKFNLEFDAVFSNAALHWMTDAEAVVRGVAKALKGGGRFVGEFGAFMNVAAISTAMIAAADKFNFNFNIKEVWFFPELGYYQELLEQNHFVVERIETFDRPTPLPSGINGWLETFSGSFLDLCAQKERAAVIAYIDKLLNPVLKNNQGQYVADYRRLRFLARKS